MKKVTLYKTQFDGIKKQMPLTIGLEPLTDKDYKNRDLNEIETITEFEATVTEDFVFEDATQEQLLNLWQNADEKTFVDYDLKK